MFESCYAENRELAKHLTHLVQSKGSPSFPVLSDATEVLPEVTGPLNVVVTANEINDLHGTGPLIKRVCKGWPNVLSIRARDEAD